jgi:membrane protease YdiL (CAAX protease family)
MIDEHAAVMPAAVLEGPAFGPVRWRGWRIAGIAMLGLAALYLVQLIIGIVLAIVTYLPYAASHPGAVPDAATLTRIIFNAPALFAMVVPGEALMAFLAIVLVIGTVGATRANLGLGRRPRFLDVVIGFLGGLSLVGVSSIVAQIQEHFFGPHPQPSVQIIMSHHGIGSFALDFVTVALAAGVCEEIMFRGVVFAALVQRLPLWTAAALSGLIFATAHFDRWSLLALWMVGIGLGLLYYHTRSLWPNMVAHTVFNAFTLVIVYWFPQYAK